MFHFPGKQDSVFRVFLQVIHIFIPGKVIYIYGQSLQIPIFPYEI